MKILSIKPIQKIKTISNQQVHNAHWELKNDVFIKSTTFKAKNENKPSDEKSFEEFKSWSNKNNFLDGKTPFEKKLGKMLGGGFEGVTYEIPETENWVIKKYNRGNFVAIPNIKPNLVELEDISPSLNIGQPIAQIQIPIGKRYSDLYYVLKKQTGESYGISQIEAKEVNETNIKKHIDSLKLLANAPQETFDKCIKDIDYVTSIGYEFDAGNPYNFMFNKETQEIKFVDINDKLTNNRNNQYGDVLYSLLDGEFAFSLNKQDGYESSKKESTTLSNKIIEKYFKAMNNQKVKFTESTYFNKILESNLFDSVLNSNSRDTRISELQARNLY